MSKADIVRDYAKGHPTASYGEIAEATGASRPTVSQALSGWETEEERSARILRSRKMRDETGSRYGTLTVVRFDAGSGWLCRCDCGRELHVSGRDLRSGRVVRCGKCSYVSAGQRFGSLVTLRRVGDGGGNGRLSRRWLCRCDCGEEAVMYESSLIAGDKTSCGCGKTLYDRQSETSGRVDGTKLSSMTAKLSKANKTGVKGVFFDKRRHRYVAQIKLRGVNRYLGSYKTLEDAAKARSEAEKVLFDPLLEENGRKKDAAI